MGQVYPFWDLTAKRYIYNLMTKERFCDNPDPSTIFKTLEAMKIHESMSDVTTFAIPKHCFGLD